MEKYSGKIMKKKKVAYRYYFNFILNFIPSDMYFYKLEKYKHKEERKDKGEKSSSDEEDNKLGPEEKAEEEKELFND